MEHSGIYVGNNEVVHLNKYGAVRKVSVEEFISGTSARNIYVSSKQGKAAGSKLVCQTALNMIGEYRSYNFLLDNCHQFTSGCLTGDFENADNFLCFLKHTVSEVLKADEWNLWQR